MFPFLSQPLLAELAPWCVCEPGGLPDTQRLAAWVAGASLQTHSGRPLRLVAPLEDGMGYEERIWKTGQVLTRPGDWHDYLNGVMWLLFPLTKAALNQRHWQQLAEVQSGRGAVRDAMTHLDECGIVVTSSEPRLLRLLQEFKWKQLFWDERQAVQLHMGFYMLGHGSCERLLAPFRGLTAKAVLVEVPAFWSALTPVEQRHRLDQCLAEAVLADIFSAPGALQPLPLLGIPGVVPENACGEYYDDVWQFRPGRRCKTPESSYNLQGKLIRQPLLTLG